jgi:alkylation response protein AidB-like acyl-CoA dehydrogenase
MDVQFSEEELLLHESILGRAEKLGPSSVSGYEDFDDRLLWERLAAAGALGLGVPEELGGAGSVTDASIAASALGQALAPVPYLGCGVLPAHLLTAAGADPAVIDAVISGRRRLAVGVDPSTFELARFEPSTGSGGLATESGAPAIAWDAAGAEGALVRGADGRLVTVGLDRPTPGVDLTRHIRRCEPARHVEEEDLGGTVTADALRWWRALALSLTAADMVGVMQGGLQLAVEHASTREQFGVAIGSFQAIQHLLAEQLVSVAGARSTAVYAAWALQRRRLEEAELAAHTAKAYCSDVGKRLCEAVVQVHGGMGVTWECRAHVFLKRMLFDRAFLGDERCHLRRIAELRRMEAARGL